MPISRYADNRITGFPIGDGVERVDAQDEKNGRGYEDDSSDHAEHQSRPSCLLAGHEYPCVVLRLNGSLRRTYVQHPHAEQFQDRRRTLLRPIRDAGVRTV